ncbi:MAG: DUF3137 domain-containing protein [Bacilli bacterium]|nr:DUF3137 domain-containing protein [Bacilli bacterium]
MQDKLNQFNQLKKKSERLVLIGGAIIAIGVIIILILAQQYNENAALIGFFVLVPGVIVAMVGGVEFSKLKKRFKVEVLSTFFQEAIPGTNYSPNAGLSQPEVYSTEFLKRADRFYSEDLLTGQLDDVEFRSSDVKLEERHVQHTRNGTRVYYVAYFVGRVFKFTFNKPFDGYLQVLESGSPLSNRGFKKVELESIDFNKKFRTFSTNELSAFYVLTPDIMEAIFELERRNPGRISLSFTGQELYIGINNNRDTFEIKMFTTIDQNMMEEFKRDLLVIKDFVHTLKLNTKIFKQI